MPMEREPDFAGFEVFHGQPEPWSPPPYPKRRPLPGPMDVHPTDLAYQRLERARAHLDALEIEVRVFIESEPFEAVIDHDREQGRYLVRGKLRREPPASLGLIAGDAIHNMRAALDNLMWQFARRHHEPPANKTLTFPILLIRERDGDRQCWELQGARAVRSVSLDVGKVVERFQPFMTQQDDPSRDLLWILNRLWNDDKHQGTIAAGGASFRHQMTARSIHVIGGMNGPYFWNETFQDGDVIAGIDYNPTGYFEADPEFLFAHYVAFRSDGTAGGRMLWDFLVEIYNYLLLDVIPAFEGL